MGLLKHVVLPFNSLLNAGLAYKLLIAEYYADTQADFGNSPETMTLMEHHLWHVLGGIALCNSINSLAAICVENSHYRMMVCALQTLFFCVDGWSYVKLGVDVPATLYVILGVNVAGLVVHSFEPGLFTKDKNDDGKKKK